MKKIKNEKGPHLRYNGFDQKIIYKEELSHEYCNIIRGFSKGLNEAEEKFLKNPKDFYSFEMSVKSSTEAFAAEYLGMVISSINELTIMTTGERENIQSKEMIPEPSLHPLEM